MYKLGNIEVTVEKYRAEFAKKHYLPFMKELMNMSGCTLLEARDFIDKVIAEEQIEVNSMSKEIQDYCLAELQEDE
ncbi:hypothetical protein [Listeria monocytogenes]|uniref:Uncharacterized protein n=1 Tax=Listeria monocytogenes serotype 1/2a TaxID=1906951 RepID=A0A9P1YNJ2_LISMN|nr:hypothetical protein [Listeria monocytogenes]EAF3075167.1 hypothetical protein [Listeria monocytogenes serotype 1/2a]EFD91398.1 predicted protein [Listeria monocytogenes FSL J2-071]EFR85941.1 hypothetical protein NT04LM_0585 [Listeria monocytogenes FSL F2-208]ALQ15425.1 hypothetical protein ATE43_00325 [Listeria monocytogenes]ALQ19626.1 hypothetical protein ATE44_08415 [Listeria monocytogenes]